MSLPSVSFAVPVRNSERVLARCLKSIREQDYPAGLIEIIVADGGSTDTTVGIARHARACIVSNPLVTGEAGKLQAARAASGDLVALVDSDNWLPDKSWLSQMVAPFAEPDVMASEPLYFAYDRRDGSINRYCALAGVNDPFCIFAGNYDRMSAFTKRWTDIEIDVQEREGYFVANLDPDALPTLGANGTIYRRRLLEPLLDRDYLFDVDVVCELVASGQTHFAKVRCGIGHDYCPDWFTFARKQARRVNDFWRYKHLRHPLAHEGYRNPGSVRRFIRNTVATVPLVQDAVRAYKANRDPAIFWHVPLCWTTLAIYAARSIRWMIWPPTIESVK